MSRQSSRRHFIIGSAAGLAAASIATAAGAQTPGSKARVVGSEHRAIKRVGGETINLYLWRKRTAAKPTRDVIVFSHGSSMAGTPVFDLQVPGKPQYSTMDWFAHLGYDTWCLDFEGYGRSDKQRPINFDIANGADDLAAACGYIAKTTGESKHLHYGLSSGGLRAAVYAQRHPEPVKCLALDAFVWTGKGSPTLEARRKRIADWRSTNRRPIDNAMVQSIFTRDHPGTADADVVDAFAKAILALDTTVPTGTYLDMTVVQPEKLDVPTLIMRGQFDGIASLPDLVEFFDRLPNPDKQFTVMPGIAHSSLHEKNVAHVHHILHSFFSQPAPVYTGG